MDVGTTIRRIAATGIIAAAGFAVVPGQARAADGPIVDITLPVTLCGVQVGVLGSASGDCPDTPPPAPAIGINLEPVTSGEILAPVTGILENPTAVLDPATLPAVLNPDTIGAVINGGDPVVNVDVPVNVCGNAVAVATDSSGECASTTRLGPDQSGAFSGNVQVDVCGNGLGVLSSAAGDCEGTGEGGNAVGLPLGLDDALPAAEVLDTAGTAVGPGRTVDVGQIIEAAGLDAIVDLNVGATICGNGAAVAEGAAGACPLATPDPSTPSTTTPATTPTTPTTTPASATTVPGGQPDDSTPATTDPANATTVPAAGDGGSNGGGAGGSGSGGGGTLPVTGGTVLPLLGLGAALAAAGIFARRVSRARRTLAA